MPKMQRMTAKECIKLLAADGWFEVSQSGSHKKLRHNSKPGVVVVPMHDNDLATGTLAKILKTAGLK